MDYTDLLASAAHGQAERFQAYTARRDEELEATLACLQQEPRTGPGPYPGRAGEPGWLSKGGIS
jgi:hypothetical protein